MYCIECGYKLDKDMKFCPKCGTKQKPLKSEVEIQEIKKDENKKVDEPTDSKLADEGMDDKSISVVSAKLNKITSVAKEAKNDLSEKVGGDKNLWKIILFASAGIMAIGTFFPYTRYYHYPTNTYSVYGNLFESGAGILTILAITLITISALGSVFVLMKKKKAILGMGIAAGSLAVLQVIGVIIFYSNVANVVYYGYSRTVESFLNGGFYLIVFAGISYFVSSLIYIKQ